MESKYGFERRTAPIEDEPVPFTGHGLPFASSNGYNH
jgi:hypothetical protein